MDEIEPHEWQSPIWMKIGNMKCMTIEEEDLTKKNKWN
jgi:hypothetical protein